MMGVVVGDALGMPVQFVDRAELKNNPSGNYGRLRNIQYATGNMVR